MSSKQKPKLKKIVFGRIEILHCLTQYAFFAVSNFLDRFSWIKVGMDLFLTFPLSLNLWQTCEASMFHLRDDGGGTVLYFWDVLASSLELSPQFVCFYCCRLVTDRKCQRRSKYLQLLFPTHISPQLRN